MFVCSLITQEWKGQLPPYFQGSSRQPRGWFQVQKIRGMGRVNWYLFYVFIAHIG